MKKGQTIDWSAVRMAKYRSKCGRAQPGDQELYERAWATDRKRYQDLEREVYADVNDKMRNGGSA